MTWRRGQAIVRRQVLQGRPWLGWVVNVVEDTPDLLVTYSAEGSAFHFPSGSWSTPEGRHPWEKLYTAWQGCGALMVQRPQDPYAVWHFWDGPNRAFRGWYINFEAPFRRTPLGFDTQDHELDIQIQPDGTWEFKDVDKLWQRHGEGRFTLSEVETILERGAQIGLMLDTGTWWWDRLWADFQPDPDWTQPGIPRGWASVATDL